ncbi:hypothetical protein [Amnibacterium kyonggiense]
MSDGPDGATVSGGGTIAVETVAMVEAAQRLAWSEQRLGELAARTGACIPTLTGAVRRARAEEALALLVRARERAAAVGGALTLASRRYGSIEHAVLDLQRGLAAALAAATGGAMRALTAVLGPLGPVIVVGAAGEAAGAFFLLRTAQRAIETGRIAPQADPVLLRGLALVLSSLDDGVRGALLVETPADLVRDDPAGPFGRERTAALLAALLLHPAGAPLSVVRTEQRATRSPHRLVDLLDRLPDGGEPAGQVRIEQLGSGSDRRWIVSIAGTVTFARDSDDEPFDLASDVLGVAHRPSDSERAVLVAMRRAGIGSDEPVLLVGHSQGALDAVRVAQDGGYRVGGVVQVGGPTGQIVLPPDVPVLAVEHDEDLVPVLGGTAASGSAGLRRLVVERSLPDGGFGVATSPATASFPAHDLGAYRRTLEAAEASGDARVVAFSAAVGRFLDGERSTTTRWRARRISSDPVPPAVGGAAPRPSR